MVHESDVRLNQSGEVWTCRKWKPATDLCSPLDVFPLFSIMRASNPEQWQELPVLTSHLHEDSPQTPQPPQLGGIAVHDGPSASKPSTQPSTSKQGCSGTKRKSRRRPSRRPTKSSKASNEVGNASPVDNVELPDIIITLDDSEYFSDEVQLSSDSSSDSSSDISTSPD